MTGRECRKRIQNCLLSIKFCSLMSSLATWRNKINLKDEFTIYTIPCHVFWHLFIGTKGNSPPGPPGPPGPQGPPGTPGAEVTQEVLLQEFKEMIKEATERRAVAVDRQTTSSQLPVALLTLQEGMTSYRRIEEAFHCKLKGPVVVDKKTLVELQNFQTPPAKGAFLRGSGMDQSTGRFAAPITGIYQFSANVHIDHSEVKRSKTQLKARDNIRVLICIESLCHRYTSLEMIVGLESNSRIFTVSVQGLLELQAGQYTSIFVDNAAGASVTIQNGSDFMGVLLGV
ncbi:adipolin isoform X3 [Vanacampus margaritifer]